MPFLKQSTSQVVRVGPFLDSTDGVTPETGLSINQADVQLSKGGNTFAQKNAASSLTHDVDGWYFFMLDATDTATLGILTLQITVAGSLPVWHAYDVLHADAYDALDTGIFKSNMIQVNANASATVNMALQYDGSSGLIGDTFPAQQSQVTGLTNTGSAINTSAESYVLTTGTQSANTFIDTGPLDGIHHEHADSAGVMDLYYQFDVTSSGIPSSARFTGYLMGNNDLLEIFAYNFVSSQWDRIGTLTGINAATNFVEDFDLFTTHVGFNGADIGKVRIRFTDGAFVLTTAVLAIDQLFVSYSVVSAALGFEGGSVWIDTNSGESGTAEGIGTITRPVDNEADARTIADNNNLKSFVLRAGSTIVLTQSYINWDFDGKRSVVVLNGQDVGGCVFLKLAITGAAIGSIAIVSDNGIAIDATLSVTNFLEQQIAGTIIFSDNAEYLMRGCLSAPTLGTIVDINGDGATPTGLVSAHWNGDIEFKGMTSVDTVSIWGFGTVTLNANCTGGTLAISAAMAVVDNSGGSVTIIQTADIHSKLPTTLTNGRMRSDILAINGATTSASNLERSTEAMTLATAITGTLTATQMTTNLTETTDAHYVGQIIGFTSGDLAGQKTDITAYNGTTKLLTFTALTEAPANLDEFVII